MGTIDFLRNDGKWLVAPFTMTFASAFGQTYFIGIFGAVIMAEFGLSNAAWGTIYSIGTLASALTLTLTGGLIDCLPIRRITLGIFVIYVGVAVLMGINPFWWLLPFAVFGLRFCGQGMMTALSQVTVARWFARNRGKAISFSGLGNSLAESTLPIIFALIITHAHWRLAWALAAVMILVVMRVLSRLLAEGRRPKATTHQERFGMFARHWTRHEMLHHWLFWVTLPSFAALPLINTMFFFQITDFATIKGWTLTDMTLLFPFFTVMSPIAMLLAGGLFDRYGTARVMGFVLLPTAFGYALLASGQAGVAFATGFALMGLSNGGFAALSGLFWPDFYGTKYLGSIRTAVLAIAVFASALGPALSGNLISAGVKYETLLWSAALYSLIGAAILVRVGWHTRGALGFVPE